MRSFQDVSAAGEEPLPIKIGENATENDQLFHAAAENNWWFHVDDQSSAHLWVDVDIMDKRTARRCASILKDHHNGKRGNGASRIMVCYTQRRDLRKDKTCPAGTVILEGGDVCRVRI
jgi:predicted ribosome quality control (RQC) complex YloA/Tae2 family protein